MQKQIGTNCMRRSDATHASKVSGFPESEYRIHYTGEHEKLYTVLRLIRRLKICGSFYGMTVSPGRLLSTTRPLNSR